jgi:hypothetical protein
MTMAAAVASAGLTLAPAPASAASAGPAQVWTGPLPVLLNTAPVPPASGKPDGCYSRPTVDVIRLPDTEGAPTYTDGFTVPFPTPGTLAAAKENPALYPIYKYEQDLAHLPAGSVAAYEWRVHVIVPSGREIKLENGHEWFVLGLRNGAAMQETNTIIAQDPAFAAPPVEAHTLQCVHVWDRGPYNTVRELPSGPTWFLDAEEHDPSTHPT